MCSYGDKDVRGLAFVQALLSEISAPTFCDGQGDIEIELRRVINVGIYTLDGLRAQIAPLLPLTSQYILEEQSRSGLPIVRECARPWIVESAADKYITLRVFVYL